MGIEPNFTIQAADIDEEEQVTHTLPFVYDDEQDQRMHENHDSSMDEDEDEDINMDVDVDVKKDMDGGEDGDMVEDED